MQGFVGFRLKIAGLSLLSKNLLGGDMRKSMAVHWFRQDLRLADNPALTMAAKHDQILPIYIFDDLNIGDKAMGEATKLWLHHSLNSLNKSLDGSLCLYKGDPAKILADLIKHYEVNAVYWNRCYEAFNIQRDKKIKEFLQKNGVEVHSANCSLLWEPWTIKNGSGSPYKVFTPFYRKGCLKAEHPRYPLPKPRKANYKHDKNKSLTVNQLDLLPKVKWDKKIVTNWKIGEKEAYKRLHEFIDEGLLDYKDGRNFPSQACVSRLSPYLHFGEISPNQVWHTMLDVGHDENVAHFCSELGWREFSYSLLYYNPDLSKNNLQSKFDNFPWNNNRNLLRAWQKGQTGVPMVDAGMRELWQTGYMHNRVRMVVGSFLVKNLRLHWRHGEEWFWDTLVDADLANNSASWQWVAGCGADAAPYFRIFNPVTQGQRFDPDGVYIRKFVPEIMGLPNKYLFSPWETPEDVLKEAGVKLGVDYPKPVVDLKASREAALKAYKSLR